MVNAVVLPAFGTDPRLKRRIFHDPQSAFYRYPTEGLEIVDVEHTMHIGTLNQAATGKCTAEAFCENMAMDPFWATFDRTVQTMLGDTWTDGFYSDEEDLDGDGPFPPNDNGSSGLTSAKVGKARGLISGYQHTFSGPDALKAMSKTPISLGMLWKDGCDNVNTTTGEITYTGSVRGGHQIAGFKVEAAKKRLWLKQSWGPWGYQNKGEMWMSFGMLDEVLGDQGDVTIYIPNNQPAPVPTPPPGPSPTPIPPTPPSPIAVNAALAAAGNRWEKNILSADTKAGKFRHAFDAWKQENGY